MQKIREALIGTAEAAQLLRIGKDTLIRMIDRGELEPVHKNPGPNGAYILRRVDVEALAAEKASA